MNSKIFLFTAYIAFLIPALNVDAADLVADVAALPGAITLYPQVPYVQLELTVAGNDIYWQQTWGPGEVATLRCYRARLC